MRDRENIRECEGRMKKRERKRWEIERIREGEGEMKRREREEMRSRERKYKDNSLGKGNNSYKNEKKKREGS